LTGYLVGRDCIARFSPMHAQDAQTRLATLVDLWKRGMDAPLPTACQTALALLSKDESAAQKAYDGADFQVEGMKPEVEEPCLARLWSDYDALASEADHANASKQLYRPLLDWIGTSIQLLPLNYMSEQATNA
jgi:exodeoxyribonuclease V gamma subunit